jgi:hypothetical protein
MEEEVKVEEEVVEIPVEDKEEVEELCEGEECQKEEPAVDAVL